MPLTNTARRHSPPLAADFICHILPPPSVWMERPPHWSSPPASLAAVISRVWTASQFSQQLIRSAGVWKSAGLRWMIWRRWNPLHQHKHKMHTLLALYWKFGGSGFVDFCFCCCCWRLIAAALFCNWRTASARLILVMKKLCMSTSAMILEPVETRFPFARSFSWWSCICRAMI